MNIKVGLLFILVLIVTSLAVTYYEPSPATPTVPVARRPSNLPSPSPLPSPTPIPEVKILPGGKHFFQTFNNCGPASLAMTFSYFDIDKSQAELGRLLRPYQNTQGDNDDKSVTLAELAQAAEDHEFVAYHRPAGNPELVKQLIAADLPVLTRTWLKVNEDIGHYRVIKGYDQRTSEFIQDDSLQGKDLRYSYEDFNQLWQAFNYEFLVMVPAGRQTEVEEILGQMTDEQYAWNQAVKLAEAQIEENSNDVYAHFNHAVALYHVGNYQDAVTAYEQVADRLPNRMLWYQIEPILAYYQLGRHDQVLTMTAQILTNHNRAFSELHYVRGLIYQQRGEAQSSQAAFADADRYNQAEYWRVNVQYPYQ